MISNKLLYGMLFLFLVSFGYAQDRQQLLMPGTYLLNLHETPLYYIPQSVFQHYSHPVLHIQTVPFQRLQVWGTQFAVVSCDSMDGKPVNSIVFLNTNVDTSVATGFVNHQTEPLYFKATDNTMILRPSYGDNPLERPQNGVFNLQGSWFSLYRHPHIENREWKDVQDERKTVYGATLSIEAAAFRIFRRLPFQSVIYNQTADSIPLYARTDTLSRPEVWFQAEENLFVRKDSLNGLWLHVSRFEIVSYWPERATVSGRPSLNGHLKETTGWVRKADLYHDRWERHLTEMPDFRFEVAGADLNDGDNDYTRGVLTAIKVVKKKSNQTVQVITDIGAEITDPLNRCLHFLDANFDGYPDIMADFADGGAGPNYANIFYLFDATTKRFVYNEALSALSQVEVDTMNHVIRSAWRNGAGQHGSAEYRFIDGKMEQTYQWDQVWGSGYFVEETEAVRQQDGQWKESLTYGAEAVADTVAIYRQPDDRQKPLTRISGSSAYLKIMDEKPLWYYVLIDYPDTLRGWIKKETVFPDNWEQVSTSFIAYTFEKAEDTYGHLIALRIRDKKSGNPLQIIGPVDNRYRSVVFEEGDYNQDGQTDFRFRYVNGEAAPVVYVFDKQRKLFIKQGD